MWVRLDPNEDPQHCLWVYLSLLEGAEATKLKEQLSMKQKEAIARSDLMDSSDDERFVFWVDFVME